MQLGGIPSPALDRNSQANNPEEKSRILGSQETAFTAGKGDLPTALFLPDMFLPSTGGWIRPCRRQLAAAPGTILDLDRRSSSVM